VPAEEAAALTKKPQQDSPAWADHRYMDDGSCGPFRPGAEFIQQANAILEIERVHLAHRIPQHDLVLVGGSGIANALTKGDVDLHLRVRADDFAQTVTVLRRTHAAVHAEIWQSSLATFSIKAALPTGLAVTPAGSEHDLRFTRSWRLLTADPDLLNAYNTMKVQSQGRSTAEYGQRKSAFFDMLVRLWSVHPAGAAGSRGRRTGTDPTTS